MKVRITHSIASASWSFYGGEVLELEQLEERIGADVAKTWLSAESGLATPVRETVEIPEEHAAEKVEERLEATPEPGAATKPTKGKKGR